MKTSKRILYFVAFVTTAFYLTWRLVATIPWHDSWFALIFGILLWGSEVVSAITGYILIWNKQKDFELEKPEIAKERYPDVDVLIATHNEDPELLYKTINACTFMEYPDKSKVHIYVCDDTNRLEVAKLADELGVGYFGLADNKDAKSGNYNNALRQTSSPLVATFDADMIPYREFLLETVPYFVEQVEAYENGDDYDKSKVGLIQTPQSFYNADIFQFNLFSESTLPNEQDFFSKEINVGNNSHGAAVYTGSNTVIFRKAIEDVGGFPTDTITEDFELGVRMNAAGYVNYSTKSPMASGLTPTDLKSVIKQRTRWGRGVIRSSYNMNIFFNPKLTKGQRIVYINGNGGEIFVFDMGNPVKIADLAQRMINLSGAKNVEIKYTGLRAGEKLYEEVLNDKESTKPSFHEKIRIANVREYDYSEVERDIEELIEVSKQYDDMLTVKKMKEIVPEFKSNNSVYEALDAAVGTAKA